MDLKKKKIDLSKAKVVYASNYPLPEGVEGVDIIPFNFPLGDYHLSRFKYLVGKFLEHPSKCNHSHNNIMKVFNITQTPTEVSYKIIDYLKQNGGYCDCEVMFNVRTEEEKEEDEQTIRNLKK